MAPSRRVLEAAALLRLGSMAFLLFVLILSVFVAPVVIPPESALGQIVEDFLISLMLVSGAIAVSDRRYAVIPLGIVAVVFTAVRWTGGFAQAEMTPTIRAAALLFALAILALVIAIKVFGKGAKVRDRLWGAIALYMLLGVIWAVAYEFVSLRMPGAYTGIEPGGKGQAYQWIWIYFSFSTLTTVGYGDITPVARIARSLSNMEALIGQLYPAIVLARLVSLPAEDTRDDEES
ncbi:potassium channel family protein [Bordetella genomosp. 11]|nr:potassium channel family protein [Bordetella genomosp. 11]